MGREVGQWADEGRVSRMPPETTEKPETSGEAPGGPGHEEDARDEADDRGSRRDVAKMKPDYAPTAARHAARTRRAGIEPATCRFGDGCSAN